MTQPTNKSEPLIELLYDELSGEEHAMATRAVAQDPRLADALAGMRRVRAAMRSEVQPQLSADAAQRMTERLLQEAATAARNNVLTAPERKQPMGRLLSLRRVLTSPSGAVMAAAAAAIVWVVFTSKVPTPAPQETGAVAQVEGTASKLKSAPELAPVGGVLVPSEPRSNTGVGAGDAEDKPAVEATGFDQLTAKNAKLAAGDPAWGRPATVAGAATSASKRGLGKGSSGADAESLYAAKRPMLSESSTVQTQPELNQDPAAAPPAALGNLMGQRQGAAQPTWAGKPSNAGPLQDTIADATSRRRAHIVDELENQNPSAAAGEASRASKAEENGARDRATTSEGQEADGRYAAQVAPGGRGGESPGGATNQGTGPVRAMPAPATSSAAQLVGIRELLRLRQCEEAGRALQRMQVATPDSAGTLEAMRLVRESCPTGNSNEQTASGAVPALPQAAAQPAGPVLNRAMNRLPESETKNRALPSKAKSKKASADAF